MHIIYTDKYGKIHDVYTTCKTIEEAEAYLKAIGATYWEIGI